MANGNSLSRVPVFGIILILAGVAFLLDQLHVIDFGWGKVLWAVVAVMGAVLAFSAFTNNEQGKIFFGTILFLFGLFFFLRSLDIIRHGNHVFWPALLMIIGFAFLMLFVSNAREWVLLIPSVLFVGLGVVFMLAELRYLYYWDVWCAIGQYWPVVLILIGIGLIAGRVARKT
jgi:hypothetical protein